MIGEDEVTGDGEKSPELRREAESRGDRRRKKTIGERNRSRREKILKLKKTITKQQMKSTQDTMEEQSTLSKYSKTSLN